LEASASGFQKRCVFKCLKLLDNGQVQKKEIVTVSKNVVLNKERLCGTFYKEVRVFRGMFL